jgi:acetyltransferase
MTALTTRQLDGDDFARHLDGLVALLIDTVASGASVGFLAPLEADVARSYWQSVRQAVESGHRIVLAAFDVDTLVGSVQLDLAGMPNAGHRAEVMKLMVHQAARQRGVGRSLMRALEDRARAAGRQLLVLDTRSGDVAEGLYAKMGYVSAGTIPRYARASSGSLDATVLMYRWLG